MLRSNHGCTDITSDYAADQGCEQIKDMSVAAEIGTKVIREGVSSLGR